jgi:hypothetical protein
MFIKERKIIWLEDTNPDASNFFFIIIYYYSLQINKKIYCILSIKEYQYLFFISLFFGQWKS